MATSVVDLGTGDMIGNTVKFLLDCKEKGRDFGNKPPPSIFMVPGAYRDLSQRSFNPKMVSIGPLHKQDENLQGFELEKMSYLHRLLDRCSGSRPEKLLQECAEKVSMKIEQIRECYVESTTYNDEELTRIMVIDGCFILDFINLLSDGVLFRRNLLAAPIILFDLVMVENQIPFFVLRDIFDITIMQSKPRTSFNEYIKRFLVWYNIFDKDIVTRVSSLDTTPDHILGLLQKSLQPGTRMSSGSYSSSANHSAMELDRAGVHFRANEDVNWAMAMKLELPRFSCFPWFWCKPTLRMPKVIINDGTEMILRNLIMYELFCGDQVHNYVTSYAWAIDALINTPEDVAKLVKSGVLVNNLGSNEEAAKMINNICKEVAILDFCYSQEWEQLDAYYNSYWPNFAAGLKRTYFSNPWTMIALFAAIALFVLTVVQTIFQVKAANPIIANKP